MSAHRILYVSDLDGTLLNKDQRLSGFTVNAVNSLVNRGMIFSYATARSYITSSKVTEGLSSLIPVIVYNGTFVLENGTGKKLVSNYFTPCDSRRILDILTEHDIYPIVYSYINDEEKFSYSPKHVTKGVRDFLETRKGDIRENPISIERLHSGEIFYFTCIDSACKMLPLYTLFKDEFQCVYHKDIYSGEQWLEISPKQATKANAILELKQLCGCDKVICFGDGKNDISMFGISDECYAVENADDQLKSMATAVIPSNDNDGVAKWLLENFQS